MSHNIEIYFDSKNIEKYIKNSEKLVIKNESCEIKKHACINTNHVFRTCVDSQEKINKLNKLFDFFIKHKCFFDTNNDLLFDIDKDLFDKSGFWFLNFEEHPNFYPQKTFSYLTLACNDKVVKHIKYMININQIDYINVRMDLGLGVIDFLVSKCKSELSNKNYNKFIERFMECFYINMRFVIENYGINFFKIMCKNNILILLFNYLKRQICIFWIIYYSIETNQTEIIDYLLKYGLEKDKVMLRDYKVLVLLIKNDNIETFMYTIQNVSISDIYILKMIEESGEFITKEYVKILLNNDKLDLDNLDILNKSIKNNPDKKLKKYVKNLILDEKN